MYLREIGKQWGHISQLRKAYTIGTVPLEASKTGSILHLLDCTKYAKQNATKQRHTAIPDPSKSAWAHPTFYSLHLHAPLASLPSQGPKRPVRSSGGGHPRPCRAQSIPRRGQLLRYGLLSGSFGRYCSAPRRPSHAARCDLARKASARSEGHRRANSAETARDHRDPHRPAPSGLPVGPRQGPPGPESEPKWPGACGNGREDRILRGPGSSKVQLGVDILPVRCGWSA